MMAALAIAQLSPLIWVVLIRDVKSTGIWGWYSMGMGEYCFWILTDGRVIKPDSRHILAVVAAPGLFGESIDSLRATFGRYGQDMKSNFEGAARAEVLARVIGRNHIRIRKNQSAPRQYWSIQLWRADSGRLDAMGRWALYMCGLPGIDLFADVVIQQLYDGSRRKTSLARLGAGHRLTTNTGLPAHGEDAESWLILN